MVIVALVGLLVASALGAVVIALLVKLVAALLKLGLALLVGAVLGTLVAAFAAAGGADGTAFGVVAGLLGFAGTATMLNRTDQPRGPTPAVSSGREPRRPPTLVAPELGERLKRTTGELRAALATDPLNMALVEASAMLDRVPELIAATEVLHRGASPGEQLMLRGTLADDLGSIAAHAEMQLAPIRRERYDVLRRWVRNRTSPDG